MKFCLPSHSLKLHNKKGELKTLPRLVISSHITKHWSSALGSRPWLVMSVCKCAEGKLRPWQPVTLFALPKASLWETSNKSKLWWRRQKRGKWFSLWFAQQTADVRSSIILVTVFLHSSDVLLKNFLYKILKQRFGAPHWRKNKLCKTSLPKILPGLPQSLQRYYCGTLKCFSSRACNGLETFSLQPSINTATKESETEGMIISLS